MRLVEFGQSLVKLPRSVDTTVRLSLALAAAATGAACEASSVKVPTKAPQAQETQIPVPPTIATTVAGVEVTVPTVEPTTKPVDTATSTATPPSPTATETAKPATTKVAATMTVVPTPEPKPDYDQVFKDNDAYSGTLLGADGKSVGGITMYFHSLKKLAAAFVVKCINDVSFQSQFNNGGYLNNSFGANQFGNRMGGSLVRGVFFEDAKLEMMNMPSCAGPVLKIRGQKEGSGIESIGKSWKKSQQLGGTPFSGDDRLAAMDFQVKVQTYLPFPQQ